jgi:adenine phosphoribosyltransferase
MNNVKFVTGKSQLKREALEQAAKETGFTNFTIECIPTKSGVPEQPIGMQQIQDGAFNRAEQAATHDATAIAVGMENGNVRQNFGGGKHEWRDLASIVIRPPNIGGYQLETESISFPTKFVEASIATGQTITAGELISREHSLCPPHDPHSFLTQDKTSRKSLLVATLKIMLEKIKQDYINLGLTPTDKVHTIDIPNGKTSYTLRLPIIEVKPGIRVALFDPMGKPELNEVLGKALTKLIPDDTDILVMPDGKAQALLHVVGRETKLPTIIFRKAPKYLKEPIISVSLNSITTAGTQHLYTGATQLTQLKNKKIVMIDDVYSTGGSAKAVHELLKQIEGAELTAIIVAFTEGPALPEGILSLGHLPLF